MEVRFLSMRDPAPPGFSCLRPRKSDLLRGALVLLLEGSLQEFSLLAGMEDRINGILVTLGPEVASNVLGRMLWQLQMPPDLLPMLRPLSEGFAQSTLLASQFQEENAGLRKEVGRVQHVHQTTRMHYNLVTDRLTQQMQQISQLNLDLSNQLERTRAAELALSESEENLAITLDSIGDALVSIDTFGRIQRMNPLAEAWSLTRRQEAHGREFGELFRLMDEQKRPINLRDLHLTSSRQGQAYHFLHSNDGAQRWVFLTASPIHDRSGQRRGTVLVFRDVTNLVQLEEQLRQKQRLDALGRLAGGVAHDFNNILNGILGYTELLQIELPASGEVHRYLQSIGTAIDRAAGLTRQLLAFARKQASQKKVVDVHALLQDTLDLAAHTFDRRIRIATEYLASEHDVMAEPSQVHTVVLNLLINARDAMPDGGTLTLRTETLLVDDQDGQFEDLATGVYLLISVLDTGCGIAKEHLSRIFEPFFTTKAPDKGTGLGLAAVYGIMRDHGGLVRVNSQVGVGTEFRLYFPVASREQGAKGVAQPFRSRGERILVVDDDVLIREFVEIALKRLGFQLSCAENGQQALALLNGADEPYDLILMDLNMPVQSGWETLQLMKEQGQRVPVVVASGFLREGEPERLAEMGVRVVLNKPFHLNELVEAVTQAITRERAAKA